MGLALRRLKEPGRYPRFWRLNLVCLGRVESGIRVEKMMTGQENKVVRMTGARTWLYFVCLALDRVSGWIQIVLGVGCRSA